MKLCVGLIRGLGVVSLVLSGIVLGLGAVTVTAEMAYAQGTASIVVEGNRRVEASTIRSYFKTGPRGAIDGPQIDEAYKALYGTGLFQDVRITRPGGRIVVTVVENPVINRIAFEGNKKLKDEILKLEIQSKERGTFSRAIVQSDVQRIVEIYRRSGRFDVRVEPKIIELPNGRVDLVYEVNEGVKTGVKSIRFVGNNNYSSYRLKEVIKTAETGWLLGFLQTTDIYDPDRIEGDRELLRRFYLKHGFVDVRVLTAQAEYDPDRQGFIVTFAIEEGDQHRVGTVEVRSNVRAVDASALQSRVRTSAGNVYNAEAVEKTVEDMTIEASRQGYSFVGVRPRADRNYDNRTVSLIYVVDEGARVYIEQINVRGNTRTRDYVIRREFDVAEGDAYNRALINRAERRLKNLNFFKTVKITTEPGSAPDRVIVNVDVEDQPTGEFSVAGGFSTADGFMGEVSIGERNLLGRGQYAKASVQYGQYSTGFQVSFVEPYFLGYRLALGLDAFVKTQRASNYVSYDTRTIGGNVRFGFALREDLSLQLRYSAYRQEITLPDYLRNCNNNPFNPNLAVNPTPDQQATTIDPSTGLPFTTNCYQDGEASLAVRRELAQGSVITSLVGYTLNYNTLDNNLSPTAGIIADVKQDFAGVGGDVQFLRTTADLRTYYEVIPDVVGFVRLQGGYIFGWGGSGLRMLDHFQMGPNLVRGFAPSGIGPRDITPGTAGDALGGSMYWGGTVELQTPLYFLPKDSGVKVAVFADAGSLWDFRGPTSWSVTNETLLLSNNNMFVNSSVGVGLLWASPLGPIRFDLAYPVTQQAFDRTQWFRFSGGANF
jgi:outer membrane protein insertion porin family